MRTRDYIGKHIDILKATRRAGYYSKEDAELEVYIDCNGIEDDKLCPLEHNAFSVRFSLDGTKITDLGRIGHCHMCGQGADAELDSFPLRDIESLAEDQLKPFLVPEATAKRQKKKYHKHLEKQRAAANAKSAEPTPKPLPKKIPSGPIGSIFRSVYACREQKGAKSITSLTRSALAARIRPTDIYRKGLYAGRRATLERYSRNELYVPEVLIMSRVYRKGVNILLENGYKPRPPVKAEVVFAMQCRFLRPNIAPIMASLLEDEGILVRPIEDPGTSAISELLAEHPKAILVLWRCLGNDVSNLDSSIAQIRDEGYKGRIMLGSTTALDKDDAKAIKAADALYENHLSAIKTIKLWSRSLK